VQIPSLNNVQISLEAVDQLRALHALANRNATPETLLDQMQVSIIALGHLKEGNQLTIDGFDVRRHLGDTQRIVLRGSK
jgi:hypothetical protein